jgi:hypothetical protein
MAEAPSEPELERLPMVLSKDGSGHRGSRYWYERADEARALAEQMAEGFPRETMFDIAAKYELMAKAAAEKEARIPKALALSQEAGASFPPRTA